MVQRSESPQRPPDPWLALSEPGLEHVLYLGATARLGGELGEMGNQCVGVGSGETC